MRNADGSWPWSRAYRVDDVWHLDGDFVRLGVEMKDTSIPIMGYRGITKYNDGKIETRATLRLDTSNGEFEDFYSLNVESLIGIIIHYRERVVTIRGLIASVEIANSGIEFEVDCSFLEQEKHAATPNSNATEQLARLDVALTELERTSR